MGYTNVMVAQAIGRVGRNGAEARAVFLRAPNKERSVAKRAAHDVQQGSNDPRYVFPADNVCLLQDLESRFDDKTNDPCRKCDGCRIPSSVAPNPVGSSVALVLPRVGFPVITYPQACQVFPRADPLHPHPDVRAAFIVSKTASHRNRRVIESLEMVNKRLQANGCARCDYPTGHDSLRLRLPSSLGPVVELQPRPECFPHEPTFRCVCISFPTRLIVSLASG